MNLIIIINNARMRTINETKFKGVEMIIRKENLERSEMKWREENTLCRHGEIQLISSKKKMNLQQTAILPRFRSWESERAILDWF